MSLAAALWAGAGVAVVAAIRARSAGRRRGGSAEGMCGAIGRTPLIELRRLSQLVGRRIVAKAEFMNPGGSIKDRPALSMVREAERAGRLRPGDTIIEATGGNTGIALALIARARGYKCLLCMGDNVAPEKIATMQLFGVRCRRPRSPPAAHRSRRRFAGGGGGQAVRALLRPGALLPHRGAHRGGARCAARPARLASGRLALTLPRGLLCVAQARAPCSSISSRTSPTDARTSRAQRPSCWPRCRATAVPRSRVLHSSSRSSPQSGGLLDAFVCSAGTGGTISGVGAFLREAVPGVTVRGGWSSPPTRPAAPVTPPPRSCSSTRRAPGCTAISPTARSRHVPCARAGAPATAWRWAH